MLSMPDRTVGSSVPSLVAFSRSAALKIAMPLDASLPAKLWSLKICLPRLGDCDKKCHPCVLGG